MTKRATRVRTDPLVYEVSHQAYTFLYSLSSLNSYQLVRLPGLLVNVIGFITQR